MKELNFDDDVISLEDVDEGDEEEELPTNRYRVTVSFIVKSESVDDAEIDLKALIGQGVIAFLDNEGKQPLLSFDIDNSEPDEL